MNVKLGLLGVTVHVPYILRSTTGDLPAKHHLTQHNHLVQAKLYLFSSPLSVIIFLLLQLGISDVLLGSSKQALLELVDTVNVFIDMLISPTLVISPFTIKIHFNRQNGFPVQGLIREYQNRYYCYI